MSTIGITVLVAMFAVAGAFIGILLSQAYSARQNRRNVPQQPQTSPDRTASTSLRIWRRWHRRK